MKTRKPQLLLKPVTLRAATSRAKPADDQYEDVPNMKLSSAFLVVLVLHVVAVGGIYAFKSIKEHKAAYAAAVSEEPAAAAASPVPAQSAVAAPETAPGGRVYLVRPADTLTRIAVSHGVTVADLEKANGLQNVAAIRVGQSLLIPDKSEPERPAPVAHHTVSHPPLTKQVKEPAPEAHAVRTYEVKKGDNPVAIARHLNVSYNELLKLNNISDPRKLQIGTKLKIPPSRKSK